MSDSGEDGDKPGTRRGLVRQNRVEEDSASDTSNWDSSVEYDTDLDEDEVKHATKRLQKKKQSEQENEGFGHVTYSAMCQILGTVPIRKVVDQLHAREMKLQHVGMNNSDCKAIACALWQNTCIEAIDLQDNGLTGEDLVPIINIVKANQNIYQLSVSDNEIDVLAAMVLDDVLRQTTVLAKLNLSGTRIGDKEVEYIAAGIQRNCSLMWLDLSHNNIGIDGAKKLGRALGDVESLQFLDLSWNHIRLSGAVALLKGIKHNHSIVDFNLSMNGLGYEGSLAMEEMLKENSHLRLLDVSNNRVNWEGVAYIARGLAKNSTLKILNSICKRGEIINQFMRSMIGDNPLNMEGCCILMKAVSALNCKLEHLGLENVPINGAVLSVVDDVLKTREFSMTHGGVLDTKDVIGIRKEKPEDPISLVVRYLSMTGIRIIDMFRMFDVNDSGEVSKTAFIRGMKKVGVPLKDGALKDVANRLDKENKGIISYSVLMNGVRNHIRAERQLTRREELKERIKLAKQRRILQTTLPHIFKRHYEDNMLMLYATRSNASIGSRSRASMDSTLRSSTTSLNSYTITGSTSDLRDTSQTFSDIYDTRRSYPPSYATPHSQNGVHLNIQKLSMNDNTKHCFKKEEKNSRKWLQYIEMYLERRKEQAAHSSASPLVPERHKSHESEHRSISVEKKRIKTVTKSAVFKGYKALMQRKLDTDSLSRRQTTPNLAVDTPTKTSSTTEIKVQRSTLLPKLEN